MGVPPLCLDLLYGGAQKNIGPAGLTIVVANESMLQRSEQARVPAMLSLHSHAQADSMLNTPPTFAVYIAGLVFEWLKEQGGVAAIEKQNIEKANLLYSYIDQSTLYSNPVKLENRSRMNVPFTLADADLDAAFLEGAKARGLVNLKGHRSVGGMRASIYNAVEQSAVDALVEYMHEFEREHAG